MAQGSHGFATGVRAICVAAALAIAPGLSALAQHGEAPEPGGPNVSSQERPPPANITPKPKPRPTAAADGGYALGQLNTDVAAAVAKARAIRARAEDAAAAGRAAEQSAERASTRAHNKEANTIVDDWGPQDGRVYSGDTKDGVRQGYGLFDFHPPQKFAGDRFGGAFEQGRFGKLGVYRFGVNDNNSAKSLLYEGEWFNEKRNGLGMYEWTYNDRYYGQFVDGDKSGYGVYIFHDGRRYEGEWSGDKRNGYGVVWAANGRVAEQGKWNGTLETPLGVQGP